MTVGPVAQVGLCSLFDRQCCRVPVSARSWCRQNADCHWHRWRFRALLMHQEVVSVGVADLFGADLNVVVHAVIAHRVECVVTLGAGHCGHDVAADTVLATDGGAGGGEVDLRGVVGVQLSEKLLCLRLLALRRVGAQSHIAAVLKFVGDHCVDAEADEAQDDRAGHDHDDGVSTAAFGI